MEQELLHVLDESGAHTGRTVARGTPPGPGEFHLAVHIWPHNAGGAYLIQRRALHLRSGPGVWATTVGYVQAGEHSTAAAIRETQEELGLVLATNDLRPFRRLTTSSLIQDIFLARIPDVPAGEIAFGEDVAAVRWATKGDIESMIAGGEFFAYSYLAELP